MSVAAKTLRLFAGAWAIILVALLLVDFSVVSLNTFLTWLPASALSAAVGALIIAIGAHVLTRLSVSMTLGRAIPASLVIGLVVGISQVFFGALLAEAVPWEPTLIIASATLTIGVIGTGTILFWQTLNDQLQQRQHLLSESLTVSETREDVAQIAAEMRDVLSHDIDAALSPARASIEERLRDQSQLPDSADWSATAEQLRAAARETVGPLSRRLWSPALPGHHRITLWSIIRNVVTQQPFQPLVMALIVLVTFLAAQISTLGWAIGLITTVMGMAVVWTVLTLANVAMRRWPNHHAAIYIVAIVGVQGTHGIAYYSRSQIGDSPYSIAELISASIVGIIVIFTTSAFGSVRSYRAAVARTMAVETDREFMASITASRVVAQLARESARILHGTVQTRLIACAVAIERAADTRDIEAFQSALSEARDALAAPRLGTEVDATTLAEEVERKVRLWSGLCEISVTIDPPLESVDDRLARDVGRVVEEGLSNAIRHGGADAIEVRITDGNGGIDVEILDNGCGPTSGDPGLGASLLDSISETWNLETTAHGARLHVSVASSH